MWQSQYLKNTSDSVSWKKCHELSWVCGGNDVPEVPGKATIIGWLILWMKSLPTLLPPGKAKSSKAIRETLVMLALFSDGRRWIKGGFHYQRWSCFINVHGQWLVCSAGNRAGCQLPEFLFVSQDAVGLWREHVNNALFPPYVQLAHPRPWTNTAIQQWDLEDQVSQRRWNIQFGYVGKQSCGVRWIHFCFYDLHSITSCTGKQNLLYHRLSIKSCLCTEPC